GEGSTQLFAIVVMYKAFAYEGLGQPDDAAWYWQTAVGLLPKIAESELATSFGDLATTLRALPREPVAPMTPGLSVTPPRIVHNVDPEYPRGAQAFDVSGLTRVRVLITKKGTLSTPVMVDTLPAPTLTYAVLEALRKWRFEPGRMDGAPVDVLFNVAVNF